MLNNYNNIDFTVTEEDIEYAEKLLLQNGEHFDEEERLPIISNFYESFDVNACPGSGKTTVLLAKLIILSKKLPLDNGHGVCVLTHTNVAIDEIKTRLGDKSEILFKYPNFFGTIQQFIDKYLAIPFFKRQTQINIRSIDDDVYYECIKKLVKKGYPKLRRMIGNCVEGGYYPQKPFEENIISFISKRYVKFQNKCIAIEYNGKEISDKLKYYNELEKLMSDYTFRKGILRYEDAITLGKEYIDRYSKLEKYFGNRFKYVFIDEMQDTKKNQQEIFDKIFDKGKIILQRFGDMNQNIGQGMGNSECGWKINPNKKLINSSKRYGEELIKFLSPLRVLQDGNMTGNSQVRTINPNIIVFNNNNINLVVEKFCCILDDYDIKPKDGEKIKIIGKIGMKVNSPYLSIKSYVKSYSKLNRNHSLKVKKSLELKQSKNLGKFYNNLISILVLVVEKDGKKINKEEIIKFLEMNYYELFTRYKAKIIEWYKNININSDEIFLKISNESIEFLSEIKEIKFDKSILKGYFSCEDTCNEEIAVSTDTISTTGKGDVSTVFGAKGETHLATLYLESNYKIGKVDRSDISKILDYMINNKSEIDKLDEEALSNAYVALSRAQKLTCIAVHYNTIQGRIKEFADYGYIIKGCDESMEALINEEAN